MDQYSIFIERFNSRIMAEFLHGSNLNAAIEDLISEAKKELLIVSPYVKLHSRVKDALLGKRSNPNLKVILVFGKNETDVSKSLGKEDLELFVSLPNIKIIYEPRLHAKFYASENTTILTSLNLYDFSQNNNIEAGVRERHSFNVLESVNAVLETVAGTEYFCDDANKYFEGVIDRGQLVFYKIPQFEGKLVLLKKFIGSKVEVDKLGELFNYKLAKLEKEEVNDVKVRKDSNDNLTGYCIRTGIPIPFNPERPMSYEAFKSWAQYEDENYREKYCHFSGEPSNGETCFARPILRKNWKVAKEAFAF